MQKRIAIAGTGSGVGKTTVTIGIMAALKRKGYVVQGFKCGPDYIDPTYHTAVTGRPSRNLDSWMLPHEIVKEVLVKGSQGADISIIEGVMGFYDGKEATSNRGSTAEISIITRTPVILIVNVESMARSAAAIVKGFQMLSDGIRIAGVLVNKVGSERHYRIVKEAIEQECRIPVIGYLKREASIEMPERHLGLIPSIERGELQPLFDQLADLFSETVDLDLLMNIAQASALQVETGVLEQKVSERSVKIAIAKDSAFHFYYPENIDLLQAYGAECIFFSPLAGETVPADADGLYIGGGFPEEFAHELSGNREVLASVRSAIASGMPTLAECGGFMYLTKEIEMTDGKVFPMAGVIPGRVKMQPRLAALGYREVIGHKGNFLIEDEAAKGHEFHYSTFHPCKELSPAYQSKGMIGIQPEGCIIGNLVAGYTHLHFASYPRLAQKWIEKCLEVKNDG